MSHSTSSGIPSSLPPLTLKIGLSYGVGVIPSALSSNIRSFFQLFFLTNVAGLTGTVAGTILLVGRLLDIISDPIIGWLSDRTHTRWGSRYPWMIGGMIPLTVVWLMQWTVPHFTNEPHLNQLLLFGYYIIINLIFDVSLTAVILPYRAMAAELTPNYSERTRITSLQSVFSMMGGVAGLVIAQIIFSLNLSAPFQYYLLSIICCILVVLSIAICIFGTFRRAQCLHHSVKQPYVEQLQASKPQSFLCTLKAILKPLKNSVFRNVLGIEFFSWLAVQITASTLPYFIANYLRLQDYHFTQLAILVQITAILVSLLWTSSKLKLDKNLIYLLGTVLWMVAQIGLFFLQPDQSLFVYAVVPFFGVGIATANIVPYSMLPDVIDWSEAKTGQRQEGVFYGLMNQAYKISVGLGLFLVGLILDLTHFVVSTGTSITPDQPHSALFAIRLIMGPIASIVLLVSMVLAYIYPISRKKHQEIILRIRP